MMLKPVALACLCAALALTTSAAQAQAAAKLKVGFMLPATGTFAALGTAIENGFRLYISCRAARSSSSRSTTRATRPRPPTTSTS
jgi:outer membrane PBP1 activator LpoA protein